MTLNNFYDVVSSFLFSSKQGQNFQNEYSVYQFNHIHYAVQYLSCCYTYLTERLSASKQSDQYFPLFIYCKLFDTHYLSLIDYIIEKHQNTIKSLYSASMTNGLYQVFYEMQLLNSFWLPLLEKSIQETIFTQLGGDLSKIESICERYLNNILNATRQPDYTFHKLLKEQSASGTLNSPAPHS